MKNKKIFSLLVTAILLIFISSTSLNIYAEEGVIDFSGGLIDGVPLYSQSNTETKYYNLTDNNLDTFETLTSINSDRTMVQLPYTSTIEGFRLLATGMSATIHLAFYDEYMNLIRLENNASTMTFTSEDINKGEYIELPYHVYNVKYVGIYRNTNGTIKFYEYNLYGDIQERPQDIDWTKSIIYQKDVNCGPHFGTIYCGGSIKQLTDGDVSTFKNFSDSYYFHNITSNLITPSSNISHVAIKSNYLSTTLKLLLGTESDSNIFSEYTYQYDITIDGSLIELPEIASGVTKFAILNDTGINMNIYEIGLFDFGDTPPVVPPTDPEQPVDGNRALLKIYLETGLTKEYDVTLSEAQAFNAWINNRLNGEGSAVYTFENVLDGPFTKRTDHIIYDKVVFYEINEYSK